VDGTPYKEGDSLDWAGKLGPHLVRVVVTDSAGNRTEQQYTITVNTSIQSVIQLIKRYVSTGQIKLQFMQPILAMLDQANHQLEIHDRKKAAKHLEDALKRLDKRLLQNYITDSALTALVTDIQSLIQEWSR
jgi:hypothetical protein